MSTINIRFDAFAVGDNIAWIPYVEEYRKQTGKTVIVSTFFNELFYEQYPELIFVEPNNEVRNIEKIYIGVQVSDNDIGFAHKHWQTIPLQKVPCDILGLEYNEIRPKISVSDIEIPFENYVCISEFSTRKMKEWLHPTGWQEVVDYLNEKDINVVSCSKQPTNLKNVIDRTGNHPLLNRAKLIQNSKMFIGVSSGLSWMAWAVKTPVIMISGVTQDWHEFKCERVIDKGVCHGCMNTSSILIDDSLDCPFLKGTERVYECTKSITSNMVIEKIEKILL